MKTAPPVPGRQGFRSFHPQATIRAGRGNFAKLQAECPIHENFRAKSRHDAWRAANDPVLEWWKDERTEAAPNSGHDRQPIGAGCLKYDRRRESHERFPSN